MRSLKDNFYGMVDLSVVLGVGITFVGLMVVAYLIWTISDQLTEGNPDTADVTGLNQQWERLNTSLGNVTTGFDDAVNLLLIAITITILAIAISALLILRGR